MSKNASSWWGRWFEGSAELVVIAICSLLLAPLVIFTSGGFRTVLGLPFVLFFPGYTLISALFPSKGRLDGIERLALGFGLSLAIVPLLGLILNFSPWGITLMPILFSTLGFILVMTAIAVYRRQELVPEERFEINLAVLASRISPGWTQQGRLDRMLTVILIIAIAGTIGTVVYAVGTPRASEKFTEFYILGPEGKAENYPREVILGMTADVIVGIINHEGETTAYRVRVYIDGQEIEQLGPVALKPEEKWEQPVSFNATRIGVNQKVEFQLYRDELTEPYRSLHLWLDVKER